MCFVWLCRRVVSAKPRPPWRWVSSWRSSASVCCWSNTDPQSNLTQALGYDPTQLEQSIHDVLLNPTHGPGAATLRTDHGVNLVPATLALAGAELTLASVFGRELRLRTALMEVRRQYDYILINSPPSLGIFTVNALTAADAVIVPLQAHVFALQALPQLEETIAIVRQLNPSLAIGGIVGDNDGPSH